MKQFFEEQLLKEPVKFISSKYFNGEDVKPNEKVLFAFLNNTKMSTNTMEKLNYFDDRFAENSFTVIQLNERHFHLFEYIEKIKYQPGTIPHIKYKTEKCVFCEFDTNIPINTPIDERYFYIEGSGQLCEKCYREIYK